MRSFRGGVHPPENKEMSLGDTSVKKAKIPSIVTIPLQQHAGRAAKPLVKVGDPVCVGTPIGEPGGFISAFIHSSVSGKIKAIDLFPHPTLRRSLAIQIASDGNDTLHQKPTENSQWREASADDIRDLTKEAGIVGMGGAMFPTHVKFTPPEGKDIDTVIINGSECEPYLTADHILMLKRPTDIIAGAALVRRATGAKQCFIAIEDNKLDALEIINSKIFSLGVKSVKTIRLKVKYPQGAEKQLIKAVLRREVPTGGLPLDVGVVVSNAATAVAVYEAVRFKKPLYERIVTVTGSCVARPQNLLVRVGTPIKHLFEECGGLLREPYVVISGGPMMGFSQDSLDAPVIKGTSGIIALHKTEANLTTSRPCIHCGNCVANCPQGLVPAVIQRSAELERYDESEEWGVMDCIECGCCAYGCPSKISLVQLIRLAKAEIHAKRAVQALQKRQKK